MLFILLVILILAGYLILTMPAEDSEEESLNEAPVLPVTLQQPPAGLEDTEEDVLNEPEALYLNVAYPPAGNPFYYHADRLFVFGTTNALSKVEVTVNGDPVEIFDPRSGNFLTMTDLPRGEKAVIVVEANRGSETVLVERPVIYPDWWQKMSYHPLSISTRGLIPAERQVLRAGDYLQVVFQGSPGAQARFRLGDAGDWYSMTERQYPGGPPGEGGIYTASLRVDQSLLPQSGISAARTITVSLRRGEEQINRVLPGRVAFLSEPVYRYLEVKAEEELKNIGWLYEMQTGRYELSGSTRGGAGYPTNAIRYLVEGTRYQAVGAFGSYYRVLIGGNTNYLIHADTVNILEKDQLVQPVLDALMIREDAEKLSLRLVTSESFPFKVSDEAGSFKVALYGLEQAEDFQLPALPVGLNDLELRPFAGDNNHLLQLSIEPAFEMIGFKNYWEEGNLLFEFYKLKPLNRVNPLDGKVIIVDPGHGGIDTGAPGPGQLHEKDVNLAMALYLAEMLSAAGVEVILTRSEDIAVNLYDRPVNIDRYNADLLISIHANAHAAGAPATEIRGLMILYNYAHNEQLADIMLETMADKSGLPAFRTWRRNIAVLRHPYPPSVLVEAGYMMHPYDNWYILRSEGQKEMARAMFEGLVEYFRLTDSSGKE